MSGSVSLDRCARTGYAVLSAFLSPGVGDEEPRAVTVTERHYIAYVERQKEHHAQGTTIPILERTSGEGVVRIGESAGLYTVNEAAWRAELESMAVLQPD